MFQCLHRRRKRADITSVFSLVALMWEVGISFFESELSLMLFPRKFADMSQSEFEQHYRSPEI